MKMVMLLDEAATRLLYDPLNLKLVRLLLQDEMSISELSRKLNVPVVRVWRRLEKLRKHGIVEIRKIINIRNIQKRLYGASAMRYVPSEIFTIMPSDPNLKNAYLLFLEIQKKLLDEQNKVEPGVKINPFDSYFYTDLKAFVSVMNTEETEMLLKKIELLLEEFKRTKTKLNDLKA